MKKCNEYDVDIFSGHLSSIKRVSGSKKALDGKWPWRFAHDIPEIFRSERWPSFLFSSIDSLARIV